MAAQTTQGPRITEPQPRQGHAHHRQPTDSAECRPLLSGRAGDIFRHVSLGRSRTLRGRWTRRYGGREPVAATDPGGSPKVLGSVEIQGNVATPHGPAVVETRDQFEQRWQATVQVGVGNETLTDPRIKGPVCIEGGKKPSGTAVDTGSAPIVLGSSALGAAVAPGTPTGVSAGPIAGATSIAVTWAALTSLGSGEIYGYVATAFTRLISTSSVETCFIQSASATSCTIEGLQPGTNYFVDVAATNSVGSSPASSPRVKATPTLLKVPGAPTAVTAAPERSILSTTIKVSWDMPPGDGGSPITGYRASVFVGGSLIGSCVAGGSERSCLIQGLREGTTYSDVQVAAINTVGTCGTGKMQGTLTTVIGSGFDEWGPPKPVSAVTLTLGAG